MPGGFIYPRISGGKVQSQTVNDTKCIIRLHLKQSWLSHNINQSSFRVDFTGALCKNTRKIDGKKFEQNSAFQMRHQESQQSCSQRSEQILYKTNCLFLPLIQHWVFIWSRAKLQLNGNSWICTEGKMSQSQCQQLLLLFLPQTVFVVFQPSSAHRNTTDKRRSNKQFWITSIPPNIHPPKPLYSDMSSLGSHCL